MARVRRGHHDPGVHWCPVVQGDLRTAPRLSGQRLDLQPDGQPILGRQVALPFRASRHRLRQVRTRTGVIKGTPYYMSPEQISGMKVDGRSDIFSLGIVLYQLLTGELPFGGENLAAIMYQITTVEPEPATKYNPKIYKAALAILNRALEKSVESRYQKAKQMGDHLRLLGQKLDDLKAKVVKEQAQ